MKYAIPDIIKKYEKAATVKMTWDNVYRDVFDYTMPMRNGYGKVAHGGKDSGNYQDNRGHLYTSTGEQSANEFVNTMQELLCPPMAKWIDLEAGYKFDVDQRKAVNDELSKLSDIANEHKNNSNFDMAFSEFCYDVFAGTGCMLILPGDEYNPLVFKAIPLKEYCVEEGPDGVVCAVYRKYSMTREQIGAQWKELEKKKYGKEAKEKDVELLEITYKDQAADKYIYQVIDYKSQEVLVDREHRTNPFIVLRWNKCASEPYGRGVGIAALNDLKTLNLVKEYSLRNLAYNLPPLLVKEDAMLDVDNLELTPYSLNVVPDTQNSIVPLSIETNHNIEAFKLQELQMDIKRTCYANTLPNEGNRQLTATEVNQRMIELRKNLNSVFGRLISEFQIPLVRRVFDILISMKKISDQFNLDDINGLVFRVKINSPISRQLKAQEAQSIAMSAQMLLQLDQSGQALMTMMKVNEAAAYMLELMGVPARFISTPEEATAKQEEMAQAQQAAAQEAQAGAVEAENAMSMGKAEAEVYKEKAKQV
jgi:hypothetical protein